MYVVEQIYYYLTWNKSSLDPGFKSRSPCLFPVLFFSAHSVLYLFVLQIKFILVTSPRLFEVVLSSLIDIVGRKFWIA